MKSLCEEFTISIKNYQLAVKRWGHPEAKPILALHGWLDNAGSFDRLAPYLSDYQIFAIDLPGHGLSSHLPEGESYHFVDAVRVIAQWVEHWKWDKFTLIGHSLGASIGSLYASSFPEKIEKLILIEALGLLTSSPEEAPARLRRSILQYAELPSKKMPLYPTLKEALEIRGKVSMMSIEAVTPIVVRGLKEISGGFTWRTDPRLKLESPYRMTEEQVCAFLKEISCPVLWIRANQGIDLDPNRSKNRQDSVKNLEVFSLDGNHHVHLEEPFKVAQVINKFLAKPFIF